MRNSLFAIAALLALTPIALASTAPTAPYTASGIFQAGSPLNGKLDACTNAQLQGHSSDCIGMRLDARGKAYQLMGHSTIPIVDLTTCFYGAGLTLIRCDTADTKAQIQSDAKSWLRGQEVDGIVPADAVQMSVSSALGASVNWFFQGS